jgi:hypothetical protein
MLKTLQVAFRVCHEVHDRARVEDVLPVERPDNRPAVLPAASTRLQTKLVCCQDLRTVQAEHNLKVILENISIDC